LPVAPEGSSARAAAIIVALTLVATWPLAARLTTSLPGDYGDPLFVTWAIGWVDATLTDAIRQPSVLTRLWDANIFFPERHTLAYSEHFIAQSVLTLPVYWISGNLLLTYNIAFLASFFFTGLGTFLLTRALIGSVAAALIAAVIATFNEYRLVWEVAHLHVLSIQWLPFVLYGLHRYFATDQRRFLAMAAAALIALNLSSIYYMAYCAPLIVVFALFELARQGLWRTPRLWLELWATAALAVVATLPALLPYMEVQQRLGVERSLAEVIQYSATLDRYGQALSGLTAALVLAVVGLGGMVRDRRYRWVTLLALTLALLSFWLSLGPVIQLGGEPLAAPALYQLLYALPGYDGLRVPARFASLFLLFLGVLGGVGAAVIESRWPRVMKLAAAPLVLALVVWAKPSALPYNRELPSAGLTPPAAYLTPSPNSPLIYQAVDSLPRGAILVEFPFGDSGYDLRYMYFAATHRRRLLNGYSGVFPPSFVERQRLLSKPTLDPPAAARAIRPATHAVVHRTAWNDNSGMVISGWLEALGARSIAEHDGAVLYELPVREEMAKQMGPGESEG
jgi:hypothetical protein